MTTLNKLLIGIFSLAAFASCTPPRYSYDSDGNAIYRDDRYSHNRYPERRYETDRHRHIREEMAQLEQELNNEERRLWNGDRYSSQRERERREKLQTKLDHLRAELSKGERQHGRARYRDNYRRSDD